MDIRKINENDAEAMLSMMKVFYASPALIHKSSERVLKKDIADAMDDSNPFIEAYIFEERGEVIGYSMVSKSYTTEYGGLCIWIEDLYFEEKARHKGNGTQFFRFIEGKYQNAVRFKLEVENENINAVNAYKKNGYAISDYFLMTKEIDKDE